MGSCLLDERSQASLLSKVSIVSNFSETKFIDCDGVLRCIYLSLYWMRKNDKKIENRW